MATTSRKTNEPENVKKAIPNGIDVPDRQFELPETADILTKNVLALNEEIPDPRMKFIFDNLVKHLHHFVKETAITTDEWMNTIQFLTRTGQKCTDVRQEFILFSDVLGVSALVDMLNNPPVGNSTQSAVLGPFFTEDAVEISHGESIASEGKGEYLYVSGRVISTSGKPVPNALIETWEADEFGFYDVQYNDREQPDCRGKLRTDQDGRFNFRAVVPTAYPIPGDGPVGELLVKMNRHNMRPAHLHVMVEAEGYHKLITSFYPDGDKFMYTDAVFGVKKSLVVDLKEITSDAEAKAKGFAKAPFKTVDLDIVIKTAEEAAKARAEVVKATQKEFVYE